MQREVLYDHCGPAPKMCFCIPTGGPYKPSNITQYTDPGKLYMYKSIQSIHIWGGDVVNPSDLYNWPKMCSCRFWATDRITL